MPEPWTRDAASHSLFSGNHGYMRSLRRSLSKGNSTLRPLEGVRGTIYQRSHAEDECPNNWILKSKTQKQHHPCPSRSL